MEKLNVLKLQKLLTLATQSSNEHEARNAAVLFCSLLCKSCTISDIAKVIQQRESRIKSNRYEEYIREQRRARAVYDFNARTVRRKARSSP